MAWRSNLSNLFLCFSVIMYIQLKWGHPWIQHEENHVGCWSQPPDQCFPGIVNKTVCLSEHCLRWCLFTQFTYWSELTSFSSFSTNYCETVHKETAEDLGLLDILHISPTSVYRNHESKNMIDLGLKKCLYCEGKTFWNPRCLWEPLSLCNIQKLWSKQQQKKHWDPSFKSHSTVNR